MQLRLISHLLLGMQALPGQQTPDGVPSFKLVLVGDGGTGRHRIGSQGGCKQAAAVTHLYTFLLNKPSLLQVKPPL